MPDARDRRVLITGGAGFIGRALSADLLRQGFDVTVADRLDPQVHGADSPTWLSREVRFLPADMTSFETARALIRTERPEVLLHLAAETGTGQSLAQPTTHCHANVMGLATVLEAMSAEAVLPRRIVLTSSRAVYGEGAYRDDAGTFYPSSRRSVALDAQDWEPWTHSRPMAKAAPHVAADTLTRPTNVYGATKLAQEHLLTAWCEGFDVESAIFRLQNVYGVGQAVRNPYTGVLLHFIRRALGGEAPLVYEGGGIVRDFVEVTDVSRALTLGVTVAEPPSTLDIGGAQSCTLLELAAKVSELCGAPAPIATVDYRPGDVRSAQADHAAAHQALGWRPERTLDDALQPLIDHVARALGVARA